MSSVFNHLDAQLHFVPVEATIDFAGCEDPRAVAARIGRHLAEKIAVRWGGADAKP